MGMHEYRSPSAFGGVTPCYVYRNDLKWLCEQADEASAWMSKEGREVRYDAADVVHELVETQRIQGSLPLRPPGGPWPVFWRTPIRGAAPARKRPPSAPLAH
jgi:hypothetical protein